MFDIKHIVYIVLFLFNVNYIFALDEIKENEDTNSTLNEVVDSIDEENLSQEQSELSNLSVEDEIDSATDYSSNNDASKTTENSKIIVTKKRIETTEEDSKLGKSYVYDKNKNPFRYSDYFIVAGYPSTSSFALSNLSNDYNMPPIFIPNSKQVDFIDDFGMKVLTTFFLSAEYRPFDKNIFNGIRLTTSYLKQSAGVSKTTPVDPDGYPVGANLVDGESFLTDYYATYDLNSYRFTINYDFFILKNSDMIVPYVGFGASMDDINLDSASNYKKKQCDPQEVLPPTDGSAPAPNDGCKVVSGDSYSLSKHNLVINSVMKVGVNLFNGYFFIEHSWIKGKTSDYNSSMQETSFAIRIPLN